MGRSESATTGATGPMLGTVVLEHHGVKGMKWGSRKGPSSKPPLLSEDHVIAEVHKGTIKQHGVKALSNADLEQLNKRMQLEQTNRDLAGKKPNTFKSGHRHVKDFLNVVKTLNDIHNTVNGPVGKIALKVAKAKVG